MRAPTRGCPLLALLALLAACQADRLVGVHMSRGAGDPAPTAEEARLEAARLPPCPPAAASEPDWRRSRTRVVRGEIAVPADWRRWTPDDSTEIWMARDTAAVVLIQRSDPRSFIEIAGIDGYVVILGGSRCGGGAAGNPAPYRVASYAPRRAGSEMKLVAQTDLLAGRDRSVHLLVLGRGRDGLGLGMVVLANLQLTGWSPPAP